MRFLSVMVLSSAVLGAQDHGGQCTRNCYPPARPVTAHTALYSKPAACSHELRVVAVVSGASLRIVSPARTESLAEENLPDDAFVLMCDELDLVPGSDAGDPIRLRGAGNVVVKTNRFTARAARMSKEVDRLVLEADGATKVQLVTAASSTAEARGFTVTGERITLTLSLGHIEVGGGTVIEPTVPALPNATVQTAAPR
jgi:hypothetical protein